MRDKDKGVGRPGGLPVLRTEPLSAQSLGHSAGIPDAVYVVWLCDENGKNAQCQDVAVVADLEAFAAYAKSEWRDARGDPERGYTLHGPDGEDLNFTLVTIQYPLLTAQAIEARRAATTGAVEDESAVGNADAPKPGSHPLSVNMGD